MSEASEKRFLRVGNPIVWGLAATVIVLIAIGSTAMVADCGLVPNGHVVCQPKWEQFLHASPNEIGDTLAGVAGSLAFVWIIVTVAMQSAELREQREVLDLQKLEMAAQAEATRDMAVSLAAQASIFEDERRQREEARAEAVLNEIIPILADTLADPNTQILWHFTDSYNSEHPESEAVFSPSQHQPDRKKNEVYIRNHSRKISEAAEKLVRFHSHLRFDRFEGDRDGFDKISRQLRELVEIEASLSQAQKIRMSRMELGTLSSAVGTILEHCGRTEGSALDSVPAAQLGQRNTTAIETKGHAT